MRLPEQRLWDTMKRNAPRHLWLQRVENTAADGMPDVLVDGRVWVELKSPSIPKRSATPLLGPVHGLNTAQRGWHMKAHSRGARSYILIRAEGWLFLLEGAAANEVNELTAEQLDERALARSWDDIFEELR